MAKEISPQEKGRYVEIIDKLQRAIEEDLHVDAASVSIEEIKRLIPRALAQRRSQFLRVVLRNRQRWLRANTDEKVCLSFVLPVASF